MEQEAEFTSRHKRNQSIRRKPRTTEEKLQLQQSLMSKRQKRKRTPLDERMDVDSPSIRRRLSDDDSLQAARSIHRCCDQMHVLTLDDIRVARTMFLRMRQKDRADFLVTEFSRSSNFTSTPGTRVPRHPIRHNVTMCRSCFNNFYGVSNGMYYTYYNRVRNRKTVRHVHVRRIRVKPKVCDNIYYFCVYCVACSTTLRSPGYLGT